MGYSRKIIIIILILPVLISVNFLSEHAQAREQYMVMEENIEVIDTDISQVYFGTLQDNPHRYYFNVYLPKRIYLSILTPDEPEARTDFFANVYHERDPGVLTQLAPDQGAWQIFEEKFDNKTYLQGPETDFGARPGKYVVEVFNSDNKGHYVLLIGKRQELPAQSWFDFFRNLNDIRKEYLTKSNISLMLKSWLFWLIFIGIIISVLSLYFIKLYQRSKRK